jgi:type II secretory pathway pseudopilin PulG
MPELKNSQRITFKATHVSTVPDIHTKGSNDPVILENMTRAVPKAAFVRALRIHESELPTLRAALKASTKRSRKDSLAVSRALRGIEDMVGDTSPMSVFNHATKFSGVKPRILSKIGSALLSTRKEFATKIQKSVETIRSDYEAHLRKTRVNEPAVPKAKASRVAPKASTKLAQPISTARLGMPSLKPVATAVAAASPSKAAQSQGKAADAGSAASAKMAPLITVSAALRWAADTNHPQFEALHSLAVARTPADAVLSNIDRASQAATGLMKIAGQPDQTQGILSAFNHYLPIEPVGRLHLERIEMTPAGIERGELVHSIPMTPKEVVNISHREWSETTQGFENIVQDEFVGYSEKGVAEKNDASQATDSESKHSTALNVGVSLSASYASVTLSSSFGYNSTSDNSQSEKDSRNHSSLVTSKASARTRKDHKTSFKVSSVAGTEDQAVRVITNPFDSAIRVDYYQMMRKWKVDLIRYGLRMTYDIVIPSPGAELMQKLDQLVALDAQINTPFAFGLSLDSVRRDNYAALAAQWNAVVEPPPLYPRQITMALAIPKNDSDDNSWGSLDFDVDDDYEVESSYFVADYDTNVNPVDDKFMFFLLEDPTPRADNNNYVVFVSNLPQLVGKSGKLSVVYSYRHVFTGEMIATLNLKPRDTVMTQWALGAWNAMREAALTQYQASLQTLKDQRASIAAEIDQFDGLTLRQMEREEIMKGVLRWLFGPAFDLIPWDIANSFESVPDDPMAVWLDPTSLNFQGNGSWQNVMQFGEFIKYIQNAIEWENVLYINYPYFWDHPANWKLKKFMYHPDPIHRMFLRSGAARVVLTIRPGFEQGFTSLMESGAFGQVPKSSPYEDIADEIRHYAETNYPGIPPANPDNNARPQLYLEQRRVWKEMQYIMQLLDYFKKDTGNNNSYPTTAQGLVVLQPHLSKVNSDNDAWNTQYASAIALNPELSRPKYTSVPQKDFWGNSYFYQSPGITGDYDLISYGADGKAGGTDKDADISANAPGSLVSTWFEYTPTSALDVQMTTNITDMA